MSQYYEKHTGGFILKRKKIAGAILLLLGIGIFIYFLFPVLSYQVFIASAYEGDKLESPIPSDLVHDRRIDVGGLIAAGINSLTGNFNDARNWYPNVKRDSLEKTKVSTYKLSIPKIGIDRVEVSTKDYDLDRHLVQYFGTAIPGEDGTAVIFGHSTIPSWFNPANYKTIFAKLHTVKEGDEIDAEVAGTIYKYKIFSIVITTPEDTTMLSQDYDNSYLTIVTCTPPGTIWKRLIVKAALVGVEEKG